MSTKDIHENNEPATPLGLGSSEGLGAWVRSAERLPDDGQSVAFVVRASQMLAYMNGRVLGGTFRAGPCGGFSVPGLTVDASHWLALPPSPIPPHVFDTEDPRCADGGPACGDCLQRGAFATAGETTPAGGIASPLHPLVIRHG